MMSVVPEILAGLSPVVDLIYPPRCPACGAAVAEQGGLCVDCWSRVEVPPALPLSERSDIGSTSVQEPSAEQEPLSEYARNGQVVAATLYNEISRDLVLRFKHGGKITLARLLARMMASQLESTGFDGSALLVPVPLHRRRLWGRGYNQSGLLARELARLGKGELCIDGLLRTKRTRSLGGLGKDERRRVLHGAIAVNSARRSTVTGREILLVDDVYTSGATSQACSKALLGAGAHRVATVCFARVATS